MILSAASASACTVPIPPIPPYPQQSDAVFQTTAGDVRDYLTTADGYATCLKTEALTLPPVPRAEALETYARVFGLMQDTVDGYNAALSAHRTGL